MPTGFAHSPAFRAVVLPCVLLAALGCAGKKTPAVKAPAPLTSGAQAAAIHAGTQALSNIRRERVLATSEKREPDYTAPRNVLAQAVDALRPTPESLPTSQYEQSAVCLETALAAVDRVIAARQASDPRSEAVGWKAFDQSVESLLIALEPQVPADARDGVSKSFEVSELLVTPADVAEPETSKVYTEEQCFSVTLPAGWIKDDESMGLSKEEKKVFGANFYGPSAGELPMRIGVHYYAPGNLLHETGQRFVQLHAQPALGVNVDGKTYSKVEKGEVAGRPAWVFERQVFEYMPPEALHPKKIPVFERFAVMPAQKGFYVLRFYVAAEAAKDNLKAYESVLASFKPDVPPVEAAAEAADGKAEAAEKADLSQPGAYRSGRWEYRLTITAPGSKSEGTVGELLFDGKPVQEPGAAGDFYRTPWGAIQWVGNRPVLWGAHGWMPRPADAKAGRDLGDPLIAAGGPVVLVKVLRDADGEQKPAQIEPWVQEELAKLGVKGFRVDRDWMPLTDQAFTIHDTKMVGTLLARLAPARDAGTLTVVLDGSVSARVELPRKDGAVKLVRHTLQQTIEPERFYLAFSIQRAAPDWPKPVEVGPEADGKVIVVTGAREVVISLPGDKRSGCTWTIKSVTGDSPPRGASVKPAGQAQYMPAAPEAGAAQGGVFENTLQVTGAGQSFVEMEYKRAWQKDQPPEKTFRVTLDVREPSANPAAAGQ